MIDDDRLTETIAAAAAGSLAAAPPRHPAETDACPSISSLATMARRGVESRFAEHVASCRRCQVTLRAAWADDDACGVTGWSCVFAAAAGKLGDAGGSNDEADLAADALLAASVPLRGARLAPELSAALEVACVNIAVALFDRDPQAADELRTLAYELGSVEPVPPEPAAEPPERQMRSLVADWAHEAAEVDGLRSARALYRSIGDRAAAGRCSRELGAMLEAEGRRDEARVELATGRLELGLAVDAIRRPL